MRVPHPRHAHVLLLVAVSIALALLVTACAQAPADRSRSDVGSLDPAPSANPRARAPVESQRPLLRRGADISWPQCPRGVGMKGRTGEGQPMPKPEARFVIIGLTNGPAFHRNPCLQAQVSWVHERNLAAAAYAVATYPTKTMLRRDGRRGPYDARTRLGRLRNTGYAQARFNLATMASVGLDSPMLWIDVEPFPSYPWSERPRRNRAVVDGIVRAYQEAGREVGFYSAQSLWPRVLGRVRYGLPEWRSVGPRGVRRALAECRLRRSFQGGPALVTQWYTDRYDFNTTCPGVARELDRWFHQF